MLLEDSLGLCGSYEFGLLGPGGYILGLSTWAV